ncbi:MAG: thioesterase family protein [Lutibacter sp.]|uniref:acyl-CoA thioesterase n=1 Tax=Lutibacter sp. TaxID=1925666 RepID=UPI00299D6B9C|nr:thioesterase family protein [Lutibacter sp.]MDX1828047.1 thioesterase family protein [Lutibacter sp.]
MQNGKNEYYSFLIKVSKNDIDDLNHVNNIQYLNWVLNAAEEHWNLVTNKEYDKNYAWVVLRHEIDYLKSAKLNNEINITTWIKDNYGVKSERIVYIKRNDELLVKAKTIWVLVNKKSMKPVRIPKEISDLFL